jgi:hypothetical protein
MSLEDRLKARIRLDGPLTVADYMAACLFDPEDGYYAVRPRLGAQGDFVTAPLISQMFGELLGLWSIEAWRRLGAPERFRWVEVGPGDGTLMEGRPARRAPGARLPPGRRAGAGGAEPPPPAVPGATPRRRRSRPPLGGRSRRA